MNRSKITLAFLLWICTLAAVAQQKAPLRTFGNVSIEELQLQTCDFEKDANAEVLFDITRAWFDENFRLIVEHHRRVKIFTDKGKKQADVKLTYITGNQHDRITNIQAQTTNLTNGKPEIVKLEKAQIFTRAIDKYSSEVAFTFPAVKPGSVIEYKYVHTTTLGSFPNWYFQETIPVLYSELQTEIPDLFQYRIIPRTTAEMILYDKNARSRTVSQTDGSTKLYNVVMEKRAYANITSLPNEAYMSSYADNLQCLIFQLMAVTPISGFSLVYSDSWAKVGGILAEDEDFGGQLKRKLKDEELLISKAMALTTTDARIAFIFNEVKNGMKWDGIDRWYTLNGTVKAWETKVGNSAEINLILYHLLKQCKVKGVYPMVVSTRSHGKVTPLYTSLAQFNRTVTYVTGSGDRDYVLDASNKNNTYRDTPAELLNSSGLFIDKEERVFDIIALKSYQPGMHSVYVTAEIKPNGKLAGNATINSTGHSRVETIERYKAGTEKQYADALREGNNALAIGKLKFENLEADTLPLTQQIDFEVALDGGDENYIYLNPNLFTNFKTNPFLSENRQTDIDLAYRRTYAIGGVYKMPKGFKIDALPKSVSMTTTDNTAVFKRAIAQQDDNIIVRCTVEYKKPIYTADEYEEFYQFAKKMYEMLNEPIILKKG